MGMGSRLCLIDDDDSIKRFSVELLGRLFRFDKKVVLPQYVGKRIRCAMAVLEVAGRQVQTIRHIDYFVLPFDDKSRVDKEEWTRGVRLALELLPSGLEGMHPKQVVDARHRFMEKRYDHEFKWRPSQEIEEKIVAGIFGPR